MQLLLQDLFMSWLFGFYWRVGLGRDIGVDCLQMALLLSRPSNLWSWHNDLIEIDCCNDSTTKVIRLNVCQKQIRILYSVGYGDLQSWSALWGNIWELKNLCAVITTSRIFVYKRIEPTLGLYGTSTK